MRRLFIFVFIALLSFSPFAGFSVSGQGAEDNAWIGVSLTDEAVSSDELERFLVGTPLVEGDIDTPRNIGTRLPTGYRFHFEYDPNAQPLLRPLVPEMTDKDADNRKDAEFMVVIVEDGTFVLAILPTSPSFVVDPPQDQTISRMDVTGTWETTFTYTTRTDDAAIVRDENGQPCTDLCTVQNLSSDPEPTAQNVVAVELPAGSRVIAPAGNYCLWCLIKDTENAPDPEEASPSADEASPSPEAASLEEGSLVAYPFMRVGDDEFSWKRSFEAAQVASPQGVEFVQGGPTSSDTTPVRMAWAFYDPSSGCN